MGFPRPEKYTLQCEWGQCRDVLELMDDFYIHLDQHFWSYVGSVTVDDGATYLCQWCECGFATTNGHDLIRHLYFHGFHTKVKWLGYLKHCQSKAGPCHTHQNRNIIPELPDGFKCCWENCYIISDIPDKFYEHVGDHVVMSDPEMLSNGKMGFKCHWEGCNYEYVTDKGVAYTGRHKLKGHMTTHTQERCYACPWCGNLYVNKTKLIDHFTRQIGVEGHNFQCTHCSRTFASERILKDHMRHHVNHYQCPKCAMTCPNPSALKHHIRYKHSSERPYACDFCDYRSKEPHDMEKHMDLHQRDSTYPCQVDGCDYEVRSLQNLQSHYRVKHGSGDGKYYACHMCEKMYSTGNQLTHHLRRIHNFQWPPGHCRFRYKECEDGLYRLQIFRYESIDISKQISLDDIDVPVNVEQSPESMPSTSTIIQSNEASAKSSVLPKKMNVKKRRKSSVQETNDTGIKRVPKRSKRIAASRMSSRKLNNTTAVNNCEASIANVEELPVLFYETANNTPDDSVPVSNLMSSPVQQGHHISTNLHSWLSTANTDSNAFSGTLDQDANHIQDVPYLMPLQEVSNVEGTIGLSERPSPPKQSFVKARKKLALDNEPVATQSNYLQWVKECSVALVPVDSPVFPNHHKLCRPPAKKGPHMQSDATGNVELQKSPQIHSGTSGDIVSQVESTVLPQAGASLIEETSHNEHTCIPSREKPDSPRPAEAKTKLSDSYLEEHPTLITINGKQVRLRHAEDQSPVDVGGVKHFLISGKDEESGGVVYCLVKASILEEIERPEL